MAAVDATVIALSPDSKYGENAIRQWSLADNDTGVAINMAEYSDRSVQVTGLTADSLAIHGSNDGTNYVLLTDPQGDALTFAANGLRQIAEATAYIKPVRTGTADVTIVVTLYLLRGRR